MNATLSGVNLAELTLRVALGEMGAPGDTRRGRPGIRSHSLMAILLGIADHGASRRELLHPHAAHKIATGAVNAYSLSAATVETIIAIDGKVDQERMIE
jgi:hypothetical protein